MIYQILALTKFKKIELSIRQMAQIPAHNHFARITRLG